MLASDTVGGVVIGIFMGLEQVPRVRLFAV